ncbi:reverse transcriptase domain-containing protein [Tanacetum coccineum]|uniref:Reverse transcriptase domain-containing protein n=1 Tax=Tanacetum coccineum TaxID=301880 RepID=A0ABQ4ZUQ5_9ASTR
MEKLKGKNQNLRMHGNCSPWASTLIALLRVGMMLVNSAGKEYTYALRFEFETTNNEAEYEALLAGLRIAKEMKIQELIIFADCQLVANQVNRLFKARQPVIKQYLEKAKELLVSFPTYSIEHIKRDQNKKADALSKLASMTFSKLAKEVLVEVLQEKSITQKEVTNVTQEEEDNWMIPIREFLQLGKLPDDPQKARKLRVKAPLYKLMDGTLYRRSYLSPWLRCVGAAQAKDIIQEVHQGSCGMHSGSRWVVSKIIRLRYYWPSMHKDVKELIQKCEACQIYSSVPRKAKQEMTSITSAWPFSQWGIDIVRLLPIAPGGTRFLVVTIDYFTKWVKAKPLISPTGKHMERFMWEYIVEVTNREVVKGMEHRLGKTHQGRVDELPQVLWVHRTTPKSSNRETPFSLVYGSEAIIPIEISVETRRIQDFNHKKNEKRRKEDLDILKERREIASIKEAHYKQKLERYYNKRVQSSTFKLGTYVLRLNSVSKTEFQGNMGPI